MVSVMLLAVLLDRRAISLRSVAIAATIVLVLRPEELLGPGFQMSFAATTALVAVYGWLRGRPDLRARVPRAVQAVGGVVLTSAVAGAATAPYGAAHFNQISDYGLLANLLSAPLMGAVVMPAAVAAAVLWPVGLAGLALEAMRLGIVWILFVAHWVAGLPGALSHVAAPGPWVLPLLSFGALVWLIWQGRARHLGLAPVAAALALWAMAERPALLISETGGLIGLMTPQGRVLSKPRGDGFAAQVWLENDGDAADQAGAAARPGLPGAPDDRRFRVGDLEVRHLTGRDVAGRLGERCGPGLVVVNQVVDARPAGPCRIVDPGTLRQSGAIAVLVEHGAARIVTARDRTGDRLWNGR
jgi:competence protein ComEC